MGLVKPAPKGIELPALSNPATAAEILSGYEAIDGVGGLIAGVMEKGVNLNEKITKYTKMAVDVCKPASNKTLSEYTFSHSLGETPKKVVIFDIDNSAVTSGNLLHLTAMLGTQPISGSSNYAYFTWNNNGSQSSQGSNSTVVVFNESTVKINLSGLSVGKNREYMLITFA